MDAGSGYQGALLTFVSVGLSKPGPFWPQRETPLPLAFSIATSREEVRMREICNLHLL